MAHVNGNTAGSLDELLDLAMKADSREIDPDAIEVGAQAGTEEKPHNEATGDVAAQAAELDKEDKTATQEASPAKAEPAKPESAETKTEDELAEKPDDSEYVKATKERQRYDRNWKKFQEEREAFKREREEFQKTKVESGTQESRRPEAESRSQAKSTLKDDRGFTAADYEEAAQGFEDEGDTKLAAQARQRAKALGQQETATAAQAQQENLVSAWNSTCNAVCKEKPELMNVETPLAKEVGALLQSEPIFSRLPDGFKRAVEIAELRITAGSVPGLKGQVEELSKKLEEANKKLALGGSNPAKPPTAKRFSDMSAQERESQLMQAAEDADRMGEPVLR